MHHYDCITRRAVFRNADQRRTELETTASPTGPDDRPSPIVGSSKVIQKASSMTIDFEADFQAFHVVQLSGR
jgi:hypothetical protein